MELLRVKNWFAISTYYVGLGKVKVNLKVDSTVNAVLVFFFFS